LSRAAALARDGGQRRLGSLEGPWPDFVDSVRSEIDRVVISHRVSRKVSGALHEETIYSPPFSRNGAAGETVRFVRVRKALSAITSGEIRDIVDGAVRARVQDRLTELGGGDPKRAFGNQENLPYLQARDGRRIPIKSVRVEKRVPAKPLGEGRTVRHVTSESNHHIELFAELRPDGSEGRWNGEVVSMLDAYRRKRAGKPIVERDHGPLAKFKFSLAPGEVIECDNGSRDRRLLVVRGLSCYTSGQIVVSMVQLNEARPMKEMTPREFLRPGPDGLRRWHARKVAVTPLGDLREAND
jgi:CRISPR-associated endonuclease Csn1